MPNPADDLITPLSVLPEGRAPQYERLYQHLLDAIRSGQLPVGSKLPSSRALSAQLGVARNSVISAYELLLSEGMIETRKGLGSYVTGLLQPLQGQRQEVNQHDAPVVVTPICERLAKASQQMPEAKGGLQPAIPDMQAFPKKAWLQANQFAAVSALNAAPDLQGAPLLREALCEHLVAARGIRASAKQIFITHGSQQALMLIFQLLAHAGSHVMLEPCGYRGVDGVLDMLDIKRSVLPADEEGILCDAHTLTGDLLVVTPSRSFPRGHTLSLARRLALLQWAQQKGGWIIEDDYDSEFVFSGHSITALQGLDHSQRVIYTGTFSRTLFPGIRLGYLIVPDALVETCRRLRRFTDGGMASQPQLAVGRMLATGDYNRHLRRMRKLYQQRYHFAYAFLSAQLPHWCCAEATGGMHFIITPPQGFALTDRMLADRAAKEELAVRPLSIYSRVESGEQGLVIGYAAHPEPQLQALLETLVGVIKSC